MKSIVTHKKNIFDVELKRRIELLHILKKLIVNPYEYTLCSICAFRKHE